MIEQQPVQPRRPPRLHRTRLPSNRVLIAAAIVALLLIVLLLARWWTNRGGPTLDPTLLPASGGSYTEGVVGIPSTLNPLLAQNQGERDLASVLFDGLTRVDGSGIPQPVLAKEWRVSDDGLDYTFLLRHDAKWHDGKPITAQDVLFTIRLIQDPDFPGNQDLARFWRGIVPGATDDWTVTFHLLQPFAPFPNYAAVPILPKHLLAGTLARDLAGEPFSKAPVGSGPFQFVSLDSDGKQVELKANPSHVGGKPYLDKVTFRFYQDADALISALKKGKVQGAGFVPVDQLFRKGTVPKNDIVYAPEISGFTGLFFNLRSPIFTNVQVRRAIQLAIDRQAIVNNALGGQAALGYGPIPASSWAYAPVGQPEHDPDRAGQMLAAAGWKDSNGDGILDNGSNQLSFPLMVNADDPQRVAVATGISRELQKIGIQVTVQPASSAQVNQALAGRQFTAALFGWQSASGDPDSYQLWHSSEADSGLNFSGFRNQKADRLLSEARTTSNLDRRKDLYTQFQKLFADQVPAVVLYYPRYHFAVSSKVHGIQASPLIAPSDRLNGLSTWFVKSAGHKSPPAPPTPSPAASPAPSPSPGS
ncbi:Extracellular solute-binding protein family 5 [Nitrolancea hollandica Lb]|uniref:Extracellular solute-binding protein family 5 n=1 Tax=Nitrolancea hollandica Lb TaxID=1129897 RepID=I4EEG0_9BACT|nr:Extracellular solute-binding protein family 5 [Nitrolancea hollandica Lb]